MIKKLLAGVIAALYCTSPAFADEDSEMDMQRALLNMQNQIQSLQQDLASANGQIEELGYKLNQSLQENANLKKQLQDAQNNGKCQDNSAKADNNNKDIGKDNSNADKNGVKDSGATASAAIKVDSKTQEQYDKAFALVKANKLNEAESAFKAFLENKENGLTPNAWYWLGQVQYKQKHYQDARISFLNAASNKTSAKRPDALYKLGLIYNSLGEKEKARKFFEVVIKTYPNDTSAILAKKQLQ